MTARLVAGTGRAAGRRMHALLVDDNPKQARFLCDGLAAEGHRVDVVTEDAQALAAARTARYDLLLLLLANSYELLRTLRAADPVTPVITVLEDEGPGSRSRGLELGADDCVSKPFSYVELQARIHAVLRRAGQPIKTRICAGELELDRSRRLAKAGDERVQLSSREFMLLEQFLEHPGEVLPRADLVAQVWGLDFDPGTNVVDVYVSYVRRKLKKLGLKPIETVRGVGYRLDPNACALAS